MSDSFYHHGFEDTRFPFPHIQVNEPEEQDSSVYLPVFTETAGVTSNQIHSFVNSTQWPNEASHNLSEPTNVPYEHHDPMPGSTQHQVDLRVDTTGPASFSEGLQPTIHQQPYVFTPQHSGHVQLSPSFTSAQDYGAPSQYLTSRISSARRTRSPSLPYLSGNPISRVHRTAYSDGSASDFRTHLNHFLTPDPIPNSAPDCHGLAAPEPITVASHIHPRVEGPAFDEQIGSRDPRQAVGLSIIRPPPPNQYLIHPTRIETEQPVEPSTIYSPYIQFPFPPPLAYNQFPNQEINLDLADVPAGLSLPMAFQNSVLAADGIALVAQTTEMHGETHPTIQDPFSRVAEMTADQQANFFTYIMHLPTRGGLFIEQKVYESTPSHVYTLNGGPKLRPPIPFRYRRRPDMPYDPIHGFPLDYASRGQNSELDKYGEQIFAPHPVTISLRLEWPGYKPHTKQIATWDCKSPPGRITRAKLAKSIAAAVASWMEGIEKGNTPCTIPRWRVGRDGIKLSDLALVSVHHVSKGSWQPMLRLLRPLSVDTYPSVASSS